MKKILCIGLTLIIFSCEELTEETAFLDYENYMNEAWIAFQTSEWDISTDLFNIGLSLEPNERSEALCGLGWTYIYKANSLVGEANRGIRDSIRAMAGDIFINAYIEEDETPYHFDIYADLLAGLTYIYNYKADSVWFMYFNDNDSQFDPILEDLMGEYSNDAINISNDLIDFQYEYFDANEYNFKYDICFNFDNIRYIRAKTYLRLFSINNEIQELELMLDELNSITSYSCSELDVLINLEEGIDCLNSLSNIFNSCN